MTDHKYIEQLLERYWQCETSVAEEDILRAFFSQPHIPKHLAAYAPLFAAWNEARQTGVSDGFEGRLRQRLNADEQQHCKALPMTLRRRIAPFLKAAAAVAIVLTVGNAARHALEGTDETAESTVDVGSPYVSSEQVDAVISEARRAGDAKATAQADCCTPCDTLTPAPRAVTAPAQ